MSHLQIVEVVRHPRERVESSGEGVPTKEEEERYQKLLHENEDMQRRIAEVRRQKGRGKRGGRGVGVAERKAGMRGISVRGV